MVDSVQLDMFGGGTDEPVLSLPDHLNCGMQECRMYEVPEIRGLYYRHGFLDDDTQSELIGRIDAGQWRRDLERRVQHYGWRYDYRARAVTPDMDLGALPAWVENVATRLWAETKLFDRAPDQAIVNEYLPGQGIALHADRDCFGRAVGTVSLGDDWEMRLRPVGATSGEDRRILLARGSALVLTGEARYGWMHGIDKRKTERSTGRQRRRRLSLTFRTMVFTDGTTVSSGG